jgi:serine/threonine protein kinase
VAFLGASVLPEEGDLVMELLPFSLSDALHKEKHRIAFTEQQKRSLVMQMAQGLMYLHTRKPRVVHRDFKPSNVMLTARLEFRIIRLWPRVGCSVCLCRDSAGAPASQDAIPVGHHVGRHPHSCPPRPQTRHGH